MRTKKSFAKMPDKTKVNVTLTTTGINCLEYFF